MCVFYILIPQMIKLMMKQTLIIEKVDQTIMTLCWCRKSIRHDQCWLNNIYNNNK